MPRPKAAGTSARAGSPTEQLATTIDTTEIVPVDLNSLLYGLESAIRAGCERKGDAACASDFAHRADARRGAIDRYLWDGTRAPISTIGGRRKRRSRGYPPRRCIRFSSASASEPQAAGVAKAATAELLQPGGIVTTPLRTGQQWDAPNGWAPLQWIAIDGLRRNGQTGLAEAIACRWLVNVQNVYRQSGKLVEKYDVMTTGRSGGGGEYPTQDGFGWTNGVMRKLMALYPTDAGYVSLSQCVDPTRQAP